MALYLEIENLLDAGGRNTLNSTVTLRKKEATSTFVKVAMKLLMFSFRADIRSWDHDLMDSGKLLYTHVPYRM